MFSLICLFSSVSLFPIRLVSIVVVVAREFDWRRNFKYLETRCDFCIGFSTSILILWFVISILFLGKIKCLLCVFNSLFMYQFLYLLFFYWLYSLPSVFFFKFPLVLRLQLWWENEPCPMKNFLTLYVPIFFFWF